MVFLNWQDEKSYEKWVPNGGNIYLIELQNGKDSYVSQVNYPLVHTSPKAFPEIETSTIVNIWMDVKNRLTRDGHSVYTTPIFATENFFKVIQFPKVAGSYENILIDNTSIALSEDTAKQLFGKDYLHSIGKTVVLDNEGSKYVVHAIYKNPEESENTIFRGGFVVRDPFVNESKESWTNYSYYGFFKVKPNTDLEKIGRKNFPNGTMIMKELKIEKNGWPDSGDHIKAHLTNIRNMKLDAKGWGLMKGDKKSIIILLSLSGLILVLSGINFINLNTAQASQRAKEVGVRKALGSSKRKLITQFFIRNSYHLCYSICNLYGHTGAALTNVWKIFGERDQNTRVWGLFICCFYCTGFHFYFRYYPCTLSFRI